MMLTALFALASTLATPPQSAPEMTGAVVADDEQTALNRRLYELVMSPDTTAEQLAAILLRGADPEARPKAVGMPGIAGVMYRAAMKLRDPRAIQVLLDAGLEPSPNIVKAAIGSNPSIEVMKLLLDANRIAAAENPRMRIPNTTNLLYVAASTNPNPAVIRFLLDSGDHDVNRREDGMLALTPFLAACQKNPNPAVLQALIEAGADITIEGGRRGNRLTALSLACGSNPSLSVIEYLLEIGCDATAPYPDGRPPYLMAALGGIHPGLFALLVEHGADPNVMLGNDAISLIAQFNPHDGMMAGAIGAGTHLRPVQPDGGSVLGLAVGNASVDPLATLLDLGIDPNAGNTPPLNSCAVLSERPEMVGLLVDAGADLGHRTTADDETFPLLTTGSTALMECAFNLTEQAPVMLQAFIDTGIEVNATNDAGLTALMLVASRTVGYRNQTVPMIRVLIAAGANASLRDRQGRTAREFAEQNPKLRDVDLETAFAPPAPAG